MNISKINNANAAKIYAEANKKLNTEKPEKGEKQVRNLTNEAAFEKSGVSISREAKSMNVLDFVKERIKADMSKEISGDKINNLKSMVKSGEYKIDTDSLAAAVINGTAQA
jgi:anti-sigma28 factor (negative regulator of flagellin synthesis)